MLNWKGIIIVGVILTIISQIIHTIGAALTMDYYLDPRYFPVWSRIMMPAEGPPPTSFLYYSMLSSLISSLIFAGFYSIIMGSIPGDSYIRKGVNYGGLIFLVTGVPFSLTLILLINLPAGLILYWAAESLVIYLIGGLLAAKIIS